MHGFRPPSAELLFAPGGGWHAAGVALGMKPEPKFLKPGDVVTLGISGLGEQRQKVVGERK